MLFYFGVYVGDLEMGSNVTQVGLELLALLSPPLSTKIRSCSPTLGTKLSVTYSSQASQGPDNRTPCFQFLKLRPRALQP